MTIIVFQPLVSHIIWKPSFLRPIQRYNKGIVQNKHNLMQSFWQQTPTYNN